MPTLQQQLRSEYRHLDNRPLPARWIRRHPELARYPNGAALVGTVRDRERLTDADQIVRALAAISSHDSSAGTVLLEALSWGLGSGMNRRLSADYRDDLLVELSLVILEADDLAQVDNLATRLVRRAQARTRRRYRTSIATREREVQVAPTDLRAPSTVDVAQLATDRAHLTATMRIIRNHLENGRLSDRAWEDCRDGCLAPAIGGPRLQHDRSRTYRGRQAVKDVLVHAS